MNRLEWQRRCLLTFVKLTIRSIQLLKSSCKVHRAVGWLKSTFVLRQRCFRCWCWCWCGAAGRGAPVGTGLGLSFLTGASTTVHHTYKSRCSLGATCSGCRQEAHARAHTHTRTCARAHTHTCATRARPLLSTSTRHLKAYRLVNGDRDARRHTALTGVAVWSGRVFSCLLNTNTKLSFSLNCW